MPLLYFSLSPTEMNTFLFFCLLFILSHAYQWFVIGSIPFRLITFHSLVYAAVVVSRNGSVWWHQRYQWGMQTSAFLQCDLDCRYSYKASVVFYHFPSRSFILPANSVSYPTFFQWIYFLLLLARAAFAPHNWDP